MKIKISKNVNSEREVLNLLKFLNDSFIPYLDKQVDLKEYASKLFNYANFIFLNDQEKTIGFVAYYINQKKSFLTSFGIHKAYHNLGLGQMLFNEYINDLMLKKIKKIELEVHATNIKALNFYKKKEFSFTVKNNDIYVGILNL